MSEYFHYVKKKSDHIVNKTVSALICAGLAFFIMFGQGTHLHSIFDHLFDHGDIHVFVHSHSHSSDHEHDENSGYDLEDSHNHPISTLNLKSVRSITPQQKVAQQTQSLISVVSLDSESCTDNLLPTYLDLPPPESISSLFLRYSFSLRAPPVG